MAFLRSKSFSGDGLRRAELLAAVLCLEPAPRGGGSLGAVLEEGIRQEVAVLEAGFPAFEKVELTGVGFVFGRGGEY